jgi:hypothetical protein
VAVFRLTFISLDVNARDVVKEMAWPLSDLHQHQPRKSAIDEGATVSATD